MTDHPLAIEKVPKKTSKYENRPERFWNIINLIQSIHNSKKYRSYAIFFYQMYMLQNIDIKVWELFIKIKL